MSKLDLSYYLNDDVVGLAKDLLGKTLVTHIGGVTTSGIIVETEAYAGIKDKASHAYNNRRTNRTETMFAMGGHAYVYLCYGIHSLFNVVTNREDVPHAILLRGVIPVKGIDEMLKRSGKKKITTDFGIGPGKISKILGITCSHDMQDLTGDVIWIEDSGIQIPSKEILSTPRIGIDYAGEDALLPYRFLVDASVVNSTL